MALDELIFAKVVRYLRTRKATAARNAHAVLLEEVRPRMLILARALTGQPVELYPAVREGGCKGNDFFLPEKSAWYDNRELNYTFYLFRILYLSAQQKLRHNWYKQEVLSDDDALRLAQEHAPDILRYLFEEYPLSRDYHSLLSTKNMTGGEMPISNNWLYGRWMADEPMKAPQEPLASIPDALPSRLHEQMPRTIVQATPVEEIITLSVDTHQQEDYVLTHNFEKVETADEFSGSWRDFDGADELEEHEEALRELNMKYTVRVNDTAHSVYETGYTANTQVAESNDAEAEGHFIAYDEWDYRKRIYRKDFSKVFPRRQQVSSTAYYDQTIAAHRAVLEQLRRMLTGIHNKWLQQRGQTHGHTIDIDRVTDRFADLAAGHTPGEAVYIADRKREKELSILLLLDLSLSSDSYANGNRVIDVAKQTAILFGEILAEFGIDFAIGGFYSRTRHYTRYVTIKDFDDPWAATRHLAGAPQPEGYTRIGPALRHSGALLQARSASNKWIILLSDGKPNDYDRYEGPYGIADVKQALRELTQQHIHTYALAIEATARYYLPQMFGQDHYQVLSSPAALFTTLIKLYERIRYAG
ncbi:nitric oxide reductase activation protein NorD [Chitinophaga flava]|uniref:NorD protein n=1 Tax=Chitinophaga flava TaxID=2259036 RepID=A0A365Y051_9BACT|nr:VWA domain-containing protein [Chitinophaga flava]RBL91698.1 NorD protein [Chitinophaga flava]